jgi:uracil-DNA glycosylase family 4
VNGGLHEAPRGAGLPFMHWKSVEEIQRAVACCRACPRLVEWREHVARERTRRFRDEDYWGRPVPGFGDPRARLLVIGLAPAAHGGNRTGRMFTGDRSGDWLFRALHRAGFASQARSVARSDGLTLRDCYISATARCAPPDNKPLPAELEACRQYLEAEADILWPRLRAVVVLGRIAFDWWIAHLRRRGIAVPRPSPKFAHGTRIVLPGAPLIICSFHPSQQNTQTRRLTEPMFDAVWDLARGALVRPQSDG